MKLGRHHIIAIYGILVLFLRPSIIGQLLGSFYFLFVAGTLLFLIAFKRKFLITIKANIFYFYLIAIFIFLIIQGLAVKIFKVDEIVKITILISMGVACSSFFERKSLHQFSKYLIGILILFAISYLITFSFLAVNISFHLGDIVLPTRGTNVAIYPVYFPFSPMYNGGAKIGATLVPRAIGFIREPGLLQMIVIMGYWIIEYYSWKYKRLMQIFLLVLLLFTFSTAGYLLFLFTFFVKAVYSIKRLSWSKISLYISGIVLALILLIGSSSQFGIEKKFGAKSGVSRVEAVLYTLDAIKRSPVFGIGFNEIPGDVELGINFLATIGQIGILGTIIFLIPYVFTFFKIRKLGYELLNIYFVLMATMFFSQPLYDKAISFLFLSFLYNLSLEHQIVNQKELDHVQK